jgi:PKD repeat protein
VTDSEGLSDNISKTVAVSGPTGPKANFDYSPSSPYVFETVTFDASASTPGTHPIINFVWDFGDGNVTSVTEPIITHVYQTSGNFTVTLNVTNAAGLTDTKSKPISIQPISGPTANFTWSPILVQPNRTVTFDASSSTPGWNGSMHPPIVSWLWDFGDGNITLVSEPIVTHIYSASGNYTVVLTVTDINGLTDSKAETVEVTGLEGDLNGDGIVDIDDVIIVALAYGSVPGDPNWNPIADITGDGLVDIDDVIYVAIRFGTSLSMALGTPQALPPYNPIQLLIIGMTCFWVSALLLTTKILAKKKLRQPKYDVWMRRAVFSFLPNLKHGNYVSFCRKTRAQSNGATNGFHPRHLFTSLIQLYKDVPLNMTFD